MTLEMGSNDALTGVVLAMFTGSVVYLGSYFFHSQYHAAETLYISFGFFVALLIALGLCFLRNAYFRRHNSDSNKPKSI